MLLLSVYLIAAYWSSQTEIIYALLPLHQILLLKVFKTKFSVKTDKPKRACTWNLAPYNTKFSCSKRDAALLVIRIRGLVFERLSYESMQCMLNQMTIVTQPVKEDVANPINNQPVITSDVRNQVQFSQLFNLNRSKSRRRRLDRWRWMTYR